MAALNLKPGQVVRFSYYAPGVQDPQKEVFVLHPNWQGNVHAIDLKRLTPAERKVLMDIMDPATQITGHTSPIVNDILNRMDPLDEIMSPGVFYQRFVAVFLRGKDAYRKYKPQTMSGVRVIEDTVADGLKQQQMPQAPPEVPGQPQRPPGFPQDRPAIGGNPLFGEKRDPLFKKD